MNYEKEFQEVELGKIVPSPFNPREFEENERFHELVESVKNIGIIEPIILRPIENNLEIVAGERRWRAAIAAAEQNGGVDSATIPAIVRKLTNKEALEIQTIENIQRENLNPMEEAKAFKIWLDENTGKICDLAQRLSISDRYIRRRLSILDLPKPMLSAWGKDKVSLTHLEQLARVGDKQKRKELFDMTVEDELSTRDLEYAIAHDSPPLKWAKFDLDECQVCNYNSDVQNEQYGLKLDKATCLNLQCFKKKQNNHLLSNWKKTKLYKDNKTLGFRFDDNINHGEYEIYTDKTPEKCLTCESFVSLIDLKGIASLYHGRICIGDKDCHKTAVSSLKKLSRKSSKDKKTDKPDPGKPRVPWHGEHFREKFFQRRIPERFNELLPDDLNILRIVLMSIIMKYSELHEWFALRHMINEDELDQFFYITEEDLLSLVYPMNAETVKEEIKAAATQAILTTSFATAGRRTIAEAAGIDLSKEFSMDEEYLNKKTRPELIDLGETLEIFTDPKAQTFLFETLLKKRGNYKSCKKDELVRIFLESGVDLVGKVPKEVLG